MCVSRRRRKGNNQKKPNFPLKNEKNKKVSFFPFRVCHPRLLTPVALSLVSSFLSFLCILHPRPPPPPPPPRRRRRRSPIPIHFPTCHRYVWQRKREGRLFFLSASFPFSNCCPAFIFGKSGTHIYVVLPSPFNAVCSSSSHIVTL